MAIWPSGLRRQNQAIMVYLVRKGEGSNPSVVMYRELYNPPFYSKMNTSFYCTTECNANTSH